jgi:signal peptidase I
MLRPGQERSIAPVKTHFPRRQTAFIGVFLIVVVMFVTTYCLGVVRGASMEPTYQDGQVVLVHRRNIFNSSLRRNEVVLLQRERGEVIIKRIFRLPGEEIPPGYPYLLQYSGMRGLTDYYEQKTERTAAGKNTRYFVPKDYIVVLGDNPSVSEDSRFFGPVPIRDILGTVVDAPGPPPSAEQGGSDGAGPGVRKDRLPHLP